MVSDRAVMFVLAPTLVLALSSVFILASFD